MHQKSEEDLWMRDTLNPVFSVEYIARTRNKARKEQQEYELARDSMGDLVLKETKHHLAGNLLFASFKPSEELIHLLSDQEYHAVEMHELSHHHDDLIEANISVLNGASIKVAREVVDIKKSDRRKTRWQEEDNQPDDRREKRLHGICKLNWDKLKAMQKETTKTPPVEATNT